MLAFLLLIGWTWSIIDRSFCLLFSFPLVHVSPLLLPLLSPVFRRRMGKFESVFDFRFKGGFLEEIGFLVKLVSKQLLWIVDFYAKI